MPKRLSIGTRGLIGAAIVFFGTAAATCAEHFENWIEIKSPYFTVYSNAGEHDGRRVAAQFEEIRALFEQTFPKLRVDSGKPTIVFALKDENSLKLLLPTTARTKMLRNWRAGTTPST